MAPAAVRTVGHGTSSRPPLPRLRPPGDLGSRWPPPRRRRYGAGQLVAGHQGPGQDGPGPQAVGHSGRQGKRGQHPDQYPEEEREADLLDVEDGLHNVSGDGRAHDRETGSVRLGSSPKFRTVVSSCSTLAQASPRTGGPQTDEHEQHQEQGKADEALIGKEVHKDVVRPVDEVGGP